MPMDAPFLLESSAPMVQAVFTLHLLFTVFLTGLIWFVQVVHYPLFRHVSNIEFSYFHQQHLACTTWVVAPPMLIEAISALVLIYLDIRILSSVPFLISLALLALIWISTALLQAPTHKKLKREQERSTLRFLIRSNWVRTICWTFRSLILSSILFQLFTPRPTG